MPNAITTVIVTHNRMSLLRKALTAHAAQTVQSSRLLVVDNASTDGSREMLIDDGWVGPPGVELLALSENTGGAGGFAAGLKHSIENGANWIWMMDDDAEPHPDALEELVKVAKDPSNVYGSLAVKGADTSWTTTLLGPTRKVVDLADEVPESSPIQSLPFLGFMIHRDLVERIGLPDAGFFIAADDIEYCMRAERAGASIIVAGKSRIEHPKSDRYVARMLARNLICLRLAPWKRYYDTRNRLLIARKYYGYKLFTQTIPGSVLRLLAALAKEPRKTAQLKAWCCGMWDGLRGVKGKRHEHWGLQP